MAKKGTQTLHLATILEFACHYTGIDCRPARRRRSKFVKPIIHDLTKLSRKNKVLWERTVTKSETKRCGIGTSFLTLLFTMGKIYGLGTPESNCKEKGCVEQSHFLSGREVEKN